jgi:uncharacterized membrane protein
MTTMPILDYIPSVRSFLRESLSSLSLLFDIRGRRPFVFLVYDKLTMPSLIYFLLLLLLLLLCIAKQKDVSQLILSVLILFVVF